MSSTKERVGALTRKFLDENSEPNFAKSFAMSEVSSVDAVAFLTAIAKEFDVDFPPEKFSDMNSLQDIVDFLDSQ